MKMKVSEEYKTTDEQGHRQFFPREVGKDNLKTKENINSSIWSNKRLLLGFLGMLSSNHNFLD